MLCFTIIIIIITLITVIIIIITIKKYQIYDSFYDWKSNHKDIYDWRRTSCLKQN
jgi:hypothetical protein